MRRSSILLSVLCVFVLVSCAIGKSDTNQTVQDTSGQQDTAVVDTDTAVVADTAADVDTVVEDKVVTDADGAVATDSQGDDDSIVEEDEQPDIDTGCNPGEFPNTCGTWAQKMFFSANAKVFSIDAAKATTETLFVIKQTQNGKDIYADSTICSVVIKTSTNGMINIDMPDTFAKGLKLLHKTAALTKETDGTFSYYQEPYWELRSVNQDLQGVLPKDYVLPTAESDPRAEDWDNNGHKGLRVVVTGTLMTHANTDIVEKSSSELWGKVEGTGQTQKIGGKVKWSDEQVVLWTDNWMAESGAKNSYDDSAENSWVQYRVPDNYTCTEVIANADTIFPK